MNEFGVLAKPDDKLANLIDHAPNGTQLLWLLLRFKLIKQAPAHVFNIRNLHDR